MKKNLQEYALFAEIISAVCIVLSLIFVGIQIEQGAEETAANTRAVNGQVRESMMNIEINMLSLVAEYPYLFALNLSTEGLTDEEIDRSGAYFVMFIRTREHFWVQRENGILDEETYISYRNTLLRMVSLSEYYRNQWFALVRSGEHVPGFVDEINAIIDETDRDQN